MSETFKKVLVVGAGALGVQIARQIARHGTSVILLDSSNEALGRAAAQLDSDRISYTAELNGNVKDCDLVIESITEILEPKRRLFRQLEALVDKDAVLATNTSMLLPRRIAKSVRHRERFCAFHFYWPDEGANLVDIMPVKQTCADVVERLRRVALETGLEPVVVKKENRGYVYNALFSAFNSKALSLVIRGVATIEDVDKSFRIVTQCPRGPFEMMDIVGLDTVLHIARNTAWKNPLNWIGVRFINRYVKQGKLGVKTGEGFYRYPR